MSARDQAAVVARAVTATLARPRAGDRQQRSAGDRIRRGGRQAVKDTQLQTTPDGRIKVGDLVAITTDWAHQLRAHVYDGRKTAEQIRDERTGRVLEIWTGGYDAHPWCSIKLDVKAAHPWEMACDLEPAIEVAR
jgi:hypothetical protein